MTGIKVSTFTLWQNGKKIGTYPHRTSAEGAAMEKLYSMGLPEEEIDEIMYSLVTYGYACGWAIEKEGEMAME